MESKPRSGEAIRGAVMGGIHRHFCRRSGADSLDPGWSRTSRRRDSVGGKHFHHYNIGIAMLTAVGAVAIRGAERHRRHPLTALSYGTGTALIVDELALLLDLEDVYWSRQGRESVDVAITLISAGGVVIAGLAFWPEARKALR